MKKVVAYKSLNHVLETSPTRAAAWDISHLSKKDACEISFTSALWMLNNKKLINEIFESLEKEFEDPDKL